MTGEHVISNNALDQIRSELLEGNQWLAFNTVSYFLDNHDVYLFKSKSEASEFAESNISEYDSYKVIHVTSVDDVLKQIPYGEHISKMLEQGKADQINLLTQKTSFMNEKNFEYLKDQVKYTGFGDALEATLKERLQKQAPQFHIVHDAKIGNETCLTTLHFKKSEQSDMYFFNKYLLEIKPENSNEKLAQTFYINKGNNVTLKEAYNLMNGRAINKDLTNKEGQIYNAWIQMDFKQPDKDGNFQMKQYHSNYGYDLEKELAKHPIKELTNEQDKTRLIESINKGNRQSVTFSKDGNDQRMYIEANPRFKAVNVYDSNFRRVHSQSLKEKSTPEQSVKQDAKKETNNQADDDGDLPKPKQKRSKRKNQSIN
ncbi:MAG: hypothetical protein WKF97_06200 [Chitinophagaceae bacterium]